ncbi:hypothetical protein [Natrinema sp. SYSU A 869]|uniref:hypothetical protein n=1 Tax=Natrinema sp. SYSU A 869 TaxID=2871694 RepID=UPI001CA3A138|nr:hypothetical protein [Natrinema sp. SYSU A 869]
MPDWILEVYRQLKSRICRGDNGLTKEKATALIVTEEIREADAEYALQRLIDRGYLYLVDDELYVTDSGSDDAEE